MAFFDDLGKRISQTGQNAVQKTKDMADVAKINAAISDEERRLNNNYLNIGKLYAELHSNDFEHVFTDMMTGIKEAEKKINEYRQQIQDIKGVVRCEKCGAEIPNNAAFCSLCGTAMPKQENLANDVGRIPCIGCGQMVSCSIKFCTLCGKAVEDSIQAQKQKRIVNKSVEDERMEKGDRTKCPGCGMEIDDDSIFCTFCGQTISKNI